MTWKYPISNTPVRVKQEVDLVGEDIVVTTTYNGELAQRRVYTECAYLVRNGTITIRRQS